MSADNLHTGHRERLKNQFIENGLDTFHEHQVLELLLFYSIPQRDTNLIAHSLINKFGSLSGVFEASYEELISVKGIKHHSAVLIKMIPQIYRKIQISKNKKSQLIDSKSSKDYVFSRYKDFVRAKLTAYDHEVFMVICLDNSNRIQNCHLLTNGNASEIQVQPREIVELALRNNSTNLIIAHNHPGGLPRPSVPDRNFTIYLEDLLANLNINLRDHIVVSDATDDPDMSTFSMASHPTMCEIFRSNFIDNEIKD